MAALRLVHAIVMWRGDQGGWRSGGGHREAALGTRAAAVQARKAGGYLPPPRALTFRGRVPERASGSGSYPAEPKFTKKELLELCGLAT